MEKLEKGSSYTNLLKFKSLKNLVTNTVEAILSPSTTSGVVRLQFGTKRKHHHNKFHIILQNTTVYMTPVRGHRRQKIQSHTTVPIHEREHIDLSNCTMRRTTSLHLSTNSQQNPANREMYAVQLISPPDRLFKHKYNYFFIRFFHESQLLQWYKELSKVCQESSLLPMGSLSSNPPLNSMTSTTSEPNSPSSSDSSDDEYCEQVIKNESESHKPMPRSIPAKTETLAWLNVIFSRFWTNMKDSQDLTERLRVGVEKITKRKLSDRNLDTYLQSICVTSIRIGNSPPQISTASVKVSAAGDITIDLDLEYLGGIKIDASCAVVIRSVSIPFYAKGEVKKMAGKLRVFVPKWPEKKMWLAWLQEPDWDLDLNLSGDMYEQLVWLAPRVGAVPKMIVKKLRVVLNSKFVLPARKYIIIPGAEDEIHTNNSEQGGGGRGRSSTSRSSACCTYF